jgi:glycerol-3-phosphate acyltransferase PlsY
MGPLTLKNGPGDSAACHLAVVRAHWYPPTRRFGEGHLVATFDGVSQ